MQRVFFYSSGQKIVGILHLPDSEEEKFPCVITCHGYYSTKDSKKYIEIAKSFCRDKFAVLRFDFRGCGESEGNIEETTLSGRVNDLKAALQLVRNHVQISKNIGLLGSSMGGCVAIIVAAEDPEILAIATWSTPSYLSSFFDKGILQRDIERYDIHEIVKRIIAPILIIHGDADELVPLFHAKGLYESSNEPKVLKIINSGDHRLSNSQVRKRAIDLSLKWFKKHM
jgi:alpha/beta superfamily hydrolase